MGCMGRLCRRSPVSVVFFFLVVFSGSMVSAQDDTLFPNPIEATSIGQLLLQLVDGVIIILIPIITLAIVWVGFQMVLVRGSKPDDYAKWRTSFVWTLIGLFLVLAAKGILEIVQNTVGQVLAP